MTAELNPAEPSSLPPHGLHPSVRERSKRLNCMEFLTIMPKPRLRSALNLDIDPRLLEQADATLRATRRAGGSPALPAPRPSRHQSSVPRESATREDRRTSWRNSASSILGSVHSHLS